MPHQLSKVEILKCGLPPRATFLELLLKRTSILKAQDRGKPYNILEKAATTTLNAL